MDQPNSLSYFHFTITLSALRTRKARPKCGRQQSYVYGTTLILAQEPELDLKKSSIVYNTESQYF